MKRRNVLKAMGFSATTLGAGGLIGLKAAEKENGCYENLEEDKFYELMGTHEDESEYREEYDLNSNGAVDEADLQIYQNSEDGPMCF